MSDVAAEMNPDRRTEIIEHAAEVAVYFLTLVKAGVEPVEAVSLTGSWTLQQRFPDMDDELEGDEWKNGDPP